MDDAQLLRIFFELYEGMPRQGPGDAISTEKAFHLLPPVPAMGHILDVGCGSGAQTLELARLHPGPITAVDNHQPFLEQLRRELARHGLDRRVQAVFGDMRELGFEPGSFDLIWSEGAVYVMGLEKGLKAWRDLLKPGGCMAVSEISWLKAEVPEDCRKFWAMAYPDLRDELANLQLIRACGFQVLGHFRLPESSWWDVYYAALERRLPDLAEKYKDDPAGREVVAQTRQEIDLYRNHSDCYGYVFYLMKRLD